MKPPSLFPKSARLRRAAEFQKLKREGVSFHGRFMVLSVLKVPAEESVRVGIITSRRVGTAVERNRVRRRLREIARLDRLKIVASHWLVLVARQKAVTAEFSELQREWSALIARAGVAL